MESWKDAPGGQGRVEAFDKEHEESGPALRSGAWLYYANGARREINPNGPLCDPPQDPQQQAKAKAVYLKLVFDRASTIFADRKAEIEKHLQSIAHSQLIMSTPPSVDAVALSAELQELRDEVRKAHKAYMQARDAAEEAAPEERRQLEAKDEEARHAANEALTRVAGITL